MKDEIVIRLDGADIVRLTQIFTDRDGDEALAFLKERLLAKVDDALRPPCGPLSAAAIKAAKDIEEKK